MSGEELISGTVFTYPYLWHRESLKGETSGRKPRPVVVAVRVPRVNKTDLLILFPITSKKPEPNRFAAEIPNTEKKRGGLEMGIPLWIVMDDCNEEIWPGSYYIAPRPTLGKFSKGFFLPLLKEFIQRRNEINIVGRHS